MSDEQRLSEYDFILVIDASGSMGETDTPNGATRWQYMQESLTTFARDVIKLDSNGIGVVTFGGASIHTFPEVCSTDHLRQIFESREPRGGTPLASALESALLMAGTSDKKDFIVVFTDGVPDDRVAAAHVLREASQCVTKDDELTILFVQVGRDQAATSYLNSLDNDLKGAPFDIVDTRTIEEADKYPNTTALILAAIAD